MGQGATAYSLTAGNGCTYIDDTAATVPPSTSKYFNAITALTATVLDYSEMITTNSYTTGIVGFDGDITIPAGTTIYPRASGIVLVSGTCLAYHE